jgi:hypothetical protein
MVSYEAMYPGTDSSLTPKYSSVGYQVDFGDIGMALDARTANQLGELNTKINPGQKRVEIGAARATEWESIPDEHFEEMRRVMEMTGVKPSVHAPVMEVSGYGQQGWSETEREQAERQMSDAVIRSHRLDPNGNIPVTMHSTGALPEMRPTKKTKEGEEPTGLFIINEQSGKVQAIPPRTRYFPEGDKFVGEQKDIDLDAELQRINKDMWSNQLSEINIHAARGGEILGQVSKEIPEELFADLAQGKSVDQIEKLKGGEEMEKQIFRESQRAINHGQIYLRDAYRNMKALFDQVYPNASKEDQAKLRDFANDAAPHIAKGIESDPKKIKEFESIISRGLRTLSEIKTPDIYKPLNEFIIDKAATTFANVASDAYKEFGNTAPIVSIENPPAGMGLSRAEDMKKLIEASREKMAQNLRKEKGMSKSEAQRVAEKMIGATWDVGHINMIRKYGYSEEDVVKESEKIAPYVKHVHLSDNFGFEHTELPMGMGNVPMAEIMKKLGEKGFEASKIIEAGNWWQYFSQQGGGNPMKPTIEAFDSPLYAMQAGPNWGALGAYGDYYSGHGPVNPQIHHMTYGAGFMETLPAELGGPMANTRSRFAGAPNQ